MTVSPDDLLCISSDLINSISDGLMIAMELRGECAMSRWLELVGPGDSTVARHSAPLSLRARFGKGQTSFLLESHACHSRINSTADKRITGAVMNCDYLFAKELVEDQNNAIMNILLKY